MSEKNLIPYILDFVHPKSVVEIGCGTGELMEGFQQEGARIQGIDGVEYAKTDFWKENKNFFQPVNLETVRINCQSKFDLAVCLECAHKYHEDRGESLVYDLCLMSDVVLFSSAIPGQGKDVVNGQMPSYWEKVFQRNGFMMLDCIRPQIWEEEEIDAEIRQNVFLCVREKMLAEYPKLLRFWLSAEKREKTEDIVHPNLWKRMVKQWSVLPLSVRRKPRVAIVCKMDAWQDLFDFIDTDEIELCACFGDWEQVPNHMRNNIKDKFYHVNELFSGIDRLEPDRYIFVCQLNDMMYNYYPKLYKRGIKKHQILDLQVYLGNVKWLGIMYQYQWNWFKREKQRFDYFVTGSSTCSMGFDLDSMKPYSGLKICANFQDLFYQYNMAKLYLDFCFSEDLLPKFIISYLGTNTFTFKTADGDYYFQDLLYFPLLSHDNMEYTGTLREQFLKRVIDGKCYKWIDKTVSTVKNFSLNDRDGLRVANDFIKQWDDNQLRGKIQYMYHKVNADKNMIPVNVDIMEKYIKLCNKYDVKLVCVRDPWAGDLEKACPKENAKEYYDIIKRFDGSIYFIDLWGLNLPRDMFTDFVHPNLKGAETITKILKEKIIKLNL